MAAVKSIRTSHRYYLASVFITYLGNSCAFIMCGKICYESFGLASVFGGLIFLEQLKLFALGTTAGVAVDRYGSRRIAVLCDFLLAASGFLFAALALRGLEKWAIIGAFFVINLLKPFYSAATYALTRQISSDDELYGLNSLSAAAQQFGYFLGLALAALLIARFTASTLLAFDAATYLVSALLLSKCELLAPTAPSAGGNGLRLSIRGFLGVLRDSKSIVGTAALIGLQINLILLYNMAIFKMVGERFPMNPEYLPALEAAYALTIVLASLALSHWPRLRVPYAGVGALFLVEGSVFALMPRAGSIIAFGVLVVIFGSLSSLLFPACFSALQKITPEEHLGKVAGFRTILQGAIAVPVLAFHTIALDVRGLSAGYALMAVMCCLAFLVFYRRMTWGSS